jgi:hypothetical protein
MESYKNFYYPGEHVLLGVDVLQISYFKSRLKASENKVRLNWDQQVDVHEMLVYGDKKQPWKQRILVRVHPSMANYYDPLEGLAVLFEGPFNSLVASTNLPNNMDMNLSLIKTIHVQGETHV